MQITGMTEAQQRELLLVDAYRAFNARDVGGALNVLHTDVDWANGRTGGRVHGHQALRRYWLEQWADVSPAVVPLQFTHDGNTVTADVAQAVFSHDGTMLQENATRHQFTFDGWRVTRMDILDDAAGSGLTDATETVVIVEAVVVEIQTD